MRRHTGQDQGGSQVQSFYVPPWDQGTSSSPNICAHQPESSSKPGWPDFLLGLHLADMIGWIIIQMTELDLQPTSPEAGMISPGPMLNPLITWLSFQVWPAPSGVILA